MFGYFKIDPSVLDNDLDGFKGIKTFMEAIEAFATAGAGTTPGNPNATYITGWQVLGNNIAGGWTKEFDAFGGANKVNGDQFEFSAPTLKTGTTDYALTKKVFGFNVGSYVYNSWSAWGVVKPYMRWVREDASGNRVQDDREYLSQFTSYTTSTRYNAWPGVTTRDMFDLGFFISVSQNYLIIRRGSIGSSGYDNPVVGVVDTTAGHPNDYAPYSPHMPFVGFDHSMGGTTGLDYDEIRFRIHYQVDESARSRGGGNATEYNQGTGQWNMEEDGDSTVTNNNYVRVDADPYVALFGPAYDHDTSENLAWYQHRYATFDDQMRVVPALHDIYMFNPWGGSPMRILHGIKEVGLSNYAEDQAGERDRYEAGYEGKIITDQDGQNWFVYEALYDAEHYQAIRAD